MMEKFLDDAEKWERHHKDTWLGRIGGSIGGATSAQLELMSPLSAVDFTRDPSLFNLAKASYGPGIAYGGYSWVSWVTGHKIYFGERIMHSADMARRTVSGGIRAIPTVVGFARWIPSLVGGIGLADVGVRGHESALASGLGWIFDQIDPWGISGFTMK